MLCVCVGDVMDVVFSVCIVRRGAVGARVWGVLSVSSCRCCMFVSCVHRSSQCCVLLDLQFVNAGRGCNRQPYRRGILQTLFGSKQRQFKTGVPQGGVLSPTLFNIYTSDLAPPSAPVQVMAYADDITITSTHTSTSAAKKYIQPYLHKVFAWTKQNNLLLNPDKTTCTLFTPDPCRIYEHSGPNNKQ